MRLIKDALLRRPGAGLCKRSVTRPAARRLIEEHGSCDKGVHEGSLSSAKHVTKHAELVVDRICMYDGRGVLEVKLSIKRPAGLVFFLATMHLATWCAHDVAVSLTRVKRSRPPTAM